MSTLRRRIDDPADFKNPNVTKVVVDRDGYALYFSRAPIPYPRGQSAAPAWRHVGLYVYRRECLLRLAALPPTALEQAEALEQLRALEHGIRIKAIETQSTRSASTRRTISSASAASSTVQDAQSGARTRRHMGDVNVNQDPGPPDPSNTSS